MTNEGKNAIVAVLFHVEARSGKRKDLIEFLEWDRQESVNRERGTLWFQVFEDPTSEHAFYVCEAYEDDMAFTEHKMHDPFKRWSSVEFQKDVVVRATDLRPVVP
jgi:quinol monooxygenase YgiN